jgi:hypothetical protein
VECLATFFIQPPPGKNPPKPLAKAGDFADDEFSDWRFQNADFI